MGWDQSYSLEDPSSLLIRLADLNIPELIKKALEAKGIKVVNTEVFEIDMGVNGLKITLNDGRIFTHKKVRSETADDYGTDYYEFRPADEEVEVEQVNLLEGEGGCGGGCGDCHCGG